MKRIFLALSIFLSLGLVGCATMNFSTLYYTPPPDYKEEVHGFWNEVKSKVPLKGPYNYSLRIVSNKETSIPGIPENDSGRIRLPDLFVKYVYENYYNDRRTIILNIILHELAHTEFNLPDKPPERHYLTDKRAIELLETYFEYHVLEYYGSFLVLRSYWTARKGVLGNVLNIGQIITTLILGGIAQDLFATDIDTRLMLMREDYKNLPVLYVFVQTELPKIAYE